MKPPKENARVEAGANKISNTDAEHTRGPSNDQAPIGRDDLLEALTRLCDAGALITVSVGETATSGWTVDLTAEEAVEYLSDPDSVGARLCGVSVEELREWREAGGYARCHAITCAGKRCRTVVACKSKAAYSEFSSPADWAEFDRLGHYCTRHGGKRKGGQP